MGNLESIRRGATVISRPEPRARVELHLSGGGEGAIPLDDLAEVASHAQELVRKLARSIAGRAGPGRPLALSEQLSDLVAVGIHQGSAILDIEAPSWSEEFEFPDEVGFDAGVQALEMVASAIQAVARNQPLPREFSRSSREEFAAFLRATTGYERVEWSVSHHGKQSAASLVPSSAVVPGLLEAPAPAERATVEGELYALNARTGSYSLEDASGRTIRCHVEPGSFLAGELDHLVRCTVRVAGIVERESSGRITDVIAEGVSGSTAPVIGEEFWSFDMEAAVEGVEAIASVADLEITGITDDEADAFREALGLE